MKVLKKEQPQYKCNDCGWIGNDDELLSASNPFDPGVDVLIGCPHCKSVNSMERLCDAVGCTLHATCGTPSEDGYRNTCFTHMRKVQGYDWRQSDGTHL